MSSPPCDIEGGLERPLTILDWQPERLPYSPA